jgi:hypothetical protein
LPCKAGEVERAFVPQQDVRDQTKLAKGSRKGLDESSRWAGTPRGTTTTTTTGWRPSCECGAGIEPCKAMDPFNGAGTSGMVALAAGRSYVGIELNPEYVRMSNGRLKRLTQGAVAAARERPPPADLGPLLRGAHG